jgi:hypothetical protein
LLPTSSLRVLRVIAGKRKTVNHSPGKSNATRIGA